MSSILFKSVFPFALHYYTDSMFVRGGENPWAVGMSKCE